MFVLIIVSGCQLSDNDSHRKQKFTQLWNESTLEFVAANCDSTLSMVLGVNSENLPIKVEEKLYTRPLIYVMDQLKHRKLLIGALQRQGLVMNIIDVLEIYDKQAYRGEVTLSSSETYRFELIGEVIDIHKAELITIGESTFATVNSTEQVCFTEFTSVPLQMRIFSTYKDSKGWRTRQVSMYD